MQVPNFKQRHLDENISDGIRTSDGEVHEVKKVNDRRGCPLRGSLSLGALIRLGCYSISVPNRVAGPDLAVVVFESKKNYQVASLGDADAVKLRDRVRRVGLSVRRPNWFFTPVFLLLKVCRSCRCPRV